jgi:hypothetical protein
MNIRTIVLLLSLSGTTLRTLSQQRAIVETPIATLRADYLRYEGEVVRVRGWLRLGREWGVFLSDDER